MLWYTEGEAGTQGLYVARSMDSGRTFSSRQLVSVGPVFGNPLLMPEEKGDNDIAVWQAGDTGVMRAEITSDGEIRGASLVMPFGKLPSAALANDRTVIVNIDSRNNKRRIWLFVANKVESISKV